MFCASPRRRHRLYPARGRRPVAGLLAVAIAILSCASPALATGPAPSTPPAKGQATFGIGPANAHGLDGRPYLRYFATPGGHTSDHIAVENLNSTPVLLSVYATDAINAGDGSLGYLPRGAASTAASWIKIGTPGGVPAITLKPRSLVVLPVQIVLPANATPGDHAGGIIASLTSKIKGKNGSQDFNFEQRIAVRTFIRVSGALRPGLTIEHLRTTYRTTNSLAAQGTAKLTFTVRNTGNLELGALQHVRIAGTFGTTGAPGSLPTVPLLLPGGSMNISETIPDVRGEFAMTAKVTLTPEALAGDVDPKLGEISATTSFFVLPLVPIVLAVVVLLVLASLVLVLRRWRRRRASTGRHSRSAPVIAIADGGAL